MNTDFARRQMVEQQVRTWDVDDVNVLDTLKAIARDQFAPTMYADLAYADTEIPLPHGQCMLRPLLDGRMLQSLELRRSDKVLEIGTGTGYLTACLATLAGSVTSIDIFPDLVAMAEDNLDDAGISNVELSVADALADLPAGEFDAILVSASVPSLPPAFTQALSPGGRLLVVVGESPVMSAMLVTRRSSDAFESEELFETDIPALVNATVPPPFSF